MPHNLPTIIVCAGVLQKPDKQVLIVQRPKNKILAGLWEFPGGKMEPGEFPQETVVREFYEEISLTIHAKDLEPFIFTSFDHGTFHLILLAFLCKKWQGQIELREQQEHYCWIPISELEKYSMPPANQIIVKRLQECV